MLNRFLLLLLITALLSTGWALWRLWLTQRTRQLVRSPVPAGVADLLPSGPALLYFTTESCARCRFQQTPILEQLTAGDAPPIYKLDALQHEALAQHYGVMTVPTTVLLDRSQRPAAINHGLATLPVLRAQAAKLRA